mmetsp:Transcript_23003/g.42347  ORF Transcript_23003/g.42347 Transcript_23003/m.42347 type:complete len:526 (-) Transcript_23003:77-1654(-)
MGSGTEEPSSREFVEGRLLDGFLLLAAGGSSAPEDVVHVNLASLQVVDVAAEDLAFFVNLDRLDLSDNQLSYEQALEQFAPLPRLTNLLLACNSIPSITITPGVCQFLQSVDLSYNELHGDVLAQLANLPRLQFLNLASNCISSVPPEEEIAGLQFLEELCLDSNDLVQFVQWRALDALSRLRKLSLASNRVKRLKDDTPEQHGGGHYFPRLEELDLSSNEITSLESLPVLKMLPSMQVLNLANNPCAGVEPLPGKGMITAKIELGVTQPWYLQGKGCHQRQRQAKPPRLRLGKQKLRKVKDENPGTMKRGLLQLAVYDPDSGQLSMDIGRPKAEGAAGGQEGPADQLLLNDDLSEEEFDQILRNRRSKIDMAFSAPTEEPSSFMRPLPFEISAEAGQRWQKLTSQEEAGPSVARSGSGTFMTGVTDESAGSEAAKMGSSAGTPRRPQFIPRTATTPVVLPPIRSDAVATSRTSTAGEQPRSRSDSLNAIMREGGKPRPLVDDGVREAMRALRAAALAEVAVGAA